MRRSLLLFGLALSGVGLAACGSSSSRSAYVPPPRQPSVLPDSHDLTGCGSRTMGGSETLVSVCDPVELRLAAAGQRVRLPDSVAVTIPGRSVNVSGTTGLTQVAAADELGTLRAPTTIILRGRSGPRSVLFVRAASLEPRHVADGEALFHDLGLAHGGVAMLGARLAGGRLVFELHRPDGTVAKPYRYSHTEGPGPQSAPQRLPEHYADDPRQGVATYVAAINARDGKTICALWSSELRAQMVEPGANPCWAVTGAFIGTGGESGSPIFERAELLDVGKPYERQSGGVTYTAVPLKLRGHYLRAKAEEFDGIVWFRRTDDGWRIAKDAAFFGASGRQVDTTPPG